MNNSDLEGFRRAIQLRDRCRTATVAASHRLEVPMSPVQANVAFDAMVDLIRDHDQTARAARSIPRCEPDPVEQIRQIRRLLIGQRAVGNLATLTAIQSVVWPDDAVLAEPAPDRCPHGHVDGGGCGPCSFDQAIPATRPQPTEGGPS